MFLEENYIIPEKDFKINLDKWKEGNPLWITGTSGDGKSTLALKLSNENKATVVSTDYLLCRLNWTKEKWEAKKDKISKVKFKTNPILDYIEKHPNLPYNIKSEKGSWADTELSEKYFNDFFKWFIRECKENLKYRNTKYIIEGCDICSFKDTKYLSTQPLIIIGCSRLQASFRRIKRDLSEDHTIIDSIFRELKRYPAYVNDLDNNKDNFKSNIKKELNEDIIIIENLNETLETLVTRPNLIGKKVTLYHGSTLKLDIVHPYTVNVGTRLSGVRTSSFWTMNKGGATCFCINDAILRIDKSIRQYCHFKLGKIAICEKDIPKLKNIIDKLNCYVYEFEIDSKYIGRGHNQELDEYTLDFPVKPTKITKLNRTQILDMLVPITEEDFNEFFEAMKDFKTNPNVKLKVNNLSKGIDGLIYHTPKQVAKLRAKYKKFRI